MQVIVYNNFLLPQVINNFIIQQKKIHLLF
jgi:hypothetical protein